jgi:hypothetical protein
MISGRLQSDEHGVGVNLDVGFHRESFPEQIKKISIHRGGGGLANFVVLANSKLTGFTAVSYFFTLTRDEPFFCLKYLAGCRVSLRLALVPITFDGNVVGLTIAARSHTNLSGDSRRS